MSARGLDAQCITDFVASAGGMGLNCALEEALGCCASCAELGERRSRSQ